jgi:hypothetical protein
MRLSCCPKNVLRIVLLALFSVLHSSPSLAWGRLGHQVIGEVGAELAGSGREFWSRNAGNLGQLALVPDTVWKSGPSGRDEGPTHWFHVDVYTSDPWVLPTRFDSFDSIVDEFSDTSVEDNGTAFWRSRQFFELSRKGFESRCYESGLQMAGALAHYVGDLSQPLHVSQDYDGRFGLQTGIHSFFETTVLSRQDSRQLKAEVKAKAASLLADPKFVASMNRGIAQAIREEMARSARYIELVLDQDERLGRGAQGSEAQYRLALDRMTDGAATLALILGQIWNDAGQPDVRETLRVNDPSWVAPRYQFRESLSDLHATCP